MYECCLQRPKSNMHIPLHARQGIYVTVSSSNLSLAAMILRHRSDGKPEKFRDYNKWIAMIFSTGCPGTNHQHGVCLLQKWSSTRFSLLYDTLNV